MKRFYCTICKKVKRVRNLPADTIRVESNDPTLRVGTCDKHHEQIARAFAPTTSRRKGA